MSLSKIAAAGFNIEVFQAEALIAALDGSGDLPDGYGMERFDEVLTNKYMEMDRLLLDDLDLVGIEQPVLIEVEVDGSWTFVDGHHRLAWAAMSDEEVPVIFVTVDIDEIDLYNAISESDIYYDHG
jgi:hypothetical protein